MKVEIIERRENPLLQREEIVAKVENKETPKRSEVKELLSAQLGEPPERIIIKTIKGLSGSHTFLITAYIYQDETVMKTVEPEYMLKRNGVIGDGEAQAQ